MYEAEADLWNQLDGPVFHCNMLASTSCEDPCDWHQITEVPYDLGKLERLAYGEVFVRDVSFGSTGEEVIVAKHIEHGTYLDSARQKSDGYCAVLGCEELLENESATNRDGNEFRMI